MPHSPKIDLWTLRILQKEWAEPQARKPVYLELKAHTPMEALWRAEQGSEPLTDDAVCSWKRYEQWKKDRQKRGAWKL